jgi:pimeloyl-ACP methyl ester carboxylesterase
VTSRLIEVAPGVRLNAIVRAPEAATKVLMIHGLKANARMWDGVGELLAARGVGSVAVDMRGHGLSDRPETGYDFTSLTDDLGAVMSQFEGRWLTAGHSWGGNVALDLTARRDDVAAAVLVDGGFVKLAERFANVEQAFDLLLPAATPEPMRADVEARLRADPADFPETAIQGRLASYEDIGEGRVQLRLSPARHRELIVHLFHHDPDECAERIRVPVTLIMVNDRGDRGDLGDRAGRVERFTSHLADGSVVWTAGPHDIHAQNPALVADAILRYV